MGEPLLLGKSKLMRRVREQIATLAVVPWHVRINGPTGSGKNLAARLIHQQSHRAGGPFVVCNLAMLPSGMELAELTGHVRGAFTGAVASRAGAFEMAHGGTLFLDEIGMAKDLTQEYLLRFVDEGLTRRIGEYRDRLVDVRIVSATNLALENCVRAGSFREDLLARLGVLTLTMPALADHPEDIPEIVTAVLEYKCREARLPVPAVPPATMDRLLEYSWPLNVRELVKTLEYYITFGSLPDVVRRAPRRVDWRDRIEDALRRHGGNKAAAADALGVSRQTLHGELRRRRQRDLSASVG
jgi:DNA-binding NtrC family response regulator